MVGHRCLEFAEAAWRCGKIRNQRGFRGSYLCPMGEFSRDGRRRIQAYDGNFASSAPFEDPLVSGRRFSPTALKTGAAGERAPTDLVLEVLIQCPLLGDIDHFHPHSHGLPVSMQRPNDFFLKLVMRWFVVLLCDVDDPSRRAEAFERKPGGARRGRTARGTAREGEGCQNGPDLGKLSLPFTFRARRRPTRVRHSRDVEPVTRCRRGGCVQPDGVDQLLLLPVRSVDRP
jgi:hypothetical protein